MAKTLFNVRADFFRAAAVFVSKAETRFYLQAVLVEPHPTKGAMIVATDGHRMLVAYDERGSSQARQPVLLNKVALNAGRGRRGENNRRRFVATSTERVIVRDGDDDLEIDCAWKAEGEFPDWRRVVPSSLARKIAVPSFNPIYLSDLAKVSAELGQRAPRVTIRPNGLADSALITFEANPEVFCLLMPVKAQAVEGLPWFMAPATEAEVA